MIKVQGDWPLEFQNQIVRLIVVANGKDWYSGSQPSLLKLKRTGRGNCVAWSKLIIEIATSYGLQTIEINIADRSEKKSKMDRHMFCIIIDTDQTIWYQSCRDLTKFIKFRGKLSNKKRLAIVKRIARIVGERAGYAGGTKVISFSYKHQQ